MDGILLLDKPAGLSSNAALQQVRRLFQAVKAGHTGSLDPLATGLLPICFGQATKLSALLLEGDKRYQVTAAVGLRTDTGDADGRPVQRSDAAQLSRGQLEALLPRFTGEILQRPPMHSAVHHEGRRLYELAREGREVERAERPVVIHALCLTDWAPGSFGLDVTCSKGTYIRTLVEDLAAAAGQCAHVAALRRTGAGPFTLAGALTPGRLEQTVADGLAALDALLLPSVAGLAGWPRVVVEAAGAAALGQGRPVRLARAPPPGRIAVLDPSGQLLGLAEVDAAGWLAPRRWMAGTPSATGSKTP